MGRLKRVWEATSNSAEDTLALGEKFGKEIIPGSVICFFGELGSGKTTFIKGLIHSFSSVSLEEINSPTFVYLNIYNGKTGMAFHFDLYRLNNQEEFLSLGFDEYLEKDGICCLEWSERIDRLIAGREYSTITLEHAGNDKRKIRIEHYA